MNVHPQFLIAEMSFDAMLKMVVRSGEVEGDFVPDDGEPVTIRDTVPARPGAMLCMRPTDAMLAGAA